MLRAIGNREGETMRPEAHTARPAWQCPQDGPGLGREITSSGPWKSFAASGSLLLWCAVAAQYKLLPCWEYSHFQNAGDGGDPAQSSSLARDSMSSQHVIGTSSRRGRTWCV